MLLATSRIVVYSIQLWMQMAIFAQRLVEVTRYNSPGSISSFSWLLLLNHEL